MKLLWIQGLYYLENARKLPCPNKLMPSFRGLRKNIDVRYLFCNFK